MTTKLITIREAADLLGINEKTLYAWTQAGRFPYVAMGSRLKKIREADVERYIEQRTHEATDAGKEEGRKLVRRLLPANVEGLRARAAAPWAVKATTLPRRVTRRTWRRGVVVVEWEAGSDDVYVMRDGVPWAWQATQPDVRAQALALLDKYAPRKAGAR